MSDRFRHREDDQQPKLYGIYRGEITSLQPYGAFVKMNNIRKNGLVHKTQISRARVDNPADVLDLGDKVYCKVISLGDDTSEGKISLSMKFVNQDNGNDLDSNLVQLKQEEQRKKKGLPFVQPKIELGAVLNTTCRKCGKTGHLTQDCFQTKDGKSYDLIPELDFESLENITTVDKKNEKKKKKKKKKDKEKQIETCDHEKKKKKKCRDKDRHNIEREKNTFSDSESDSVSSDSLVKGHRSRFDNRKGEDFQKGERRLNKKRRTSEKKSVSSDKDLDSSYGPNRHQRKENRKGDGIVIHERSDERRKTSSLKRSLSSDEDSDSSPNRHRRKDIERYYGHDSRRRDYRKTESSHRKKRISLSSEDDYETKH